MAVLVPTTEEYAEDFDNLEARVQKLEEFISNTNLTQPTPLTVTEQVTAQVQATRSRSVLKSKLPTRDGSPYYLVCITPTLQIPANSLIIAMGEAHCDPVPSKSSYETAVVTSLRLMSGSNYIYDLCRAKGNDLMWKKKTIINRNTTYHAQSAIQNARVALYMRSINNHNSGYTTISHAETSIGVITP